MSLSFFPTTNRFVISSSPQQQQHKLTLPPIHHPIQTKTTTDHQQREPRRHLPTCADDIEFFFSGTQRVTTTRHSHRPPHPSIICFAFLMSTIYLFSSFPTQQIHSSSQQHQTHVPPSIPFPSDNPYPSSNLTGLPQSRSPDTLRTQPCRWRFCVHRRRHQPTIARRGPEFVGDWIVRRISSLLWTNRSFHHPTGCTHSLRKRRQWPLHHRRMSELN